VSLTETEEYYRDKKGLKTKKQKRFKNKKGLKTKKNFNCTDTKEPNPQEQEKFLTFGEYQGIFQVSRHKKMEHIVDSKKIENKALNNTREGNVFPCMCFNLNKSFQRLEQDKIVATEIK